MEEVVEKRKHESAESFVGKEIVNKKGAILKIIGLHPDREKSGERKFLVTCSECNKDLELFPDGYLLPQNLTLWLENHHVGAVNQSQIKDKQRY